jgi:hypothetical protein
MQFDEGQHYFYNDYNNFNSKGLLAFSRQLGSTFSLIVGNFTDQKQTTSFASPVSCSYIEQIEGVQNLPGAVAGVAQTLSVSSNYGCIWTASERYSGMRLTLDERFCLPITDRTAIGTYKRVFPLLKILAKGIRSLW